MLMETYTGRIEFLAPEIAFADVQRHVPQIPKRRGISEETISALLDRDLLGRLPGLVASVPLDVYVELESEARRRLLGRDESDCPYVALALTLGCPVWTEDMDFFGSGIPTWTTDRVESYLRSDP
jgi:predicted nucleic acid-binding protein